MNTRKYTVGTQVNYLTIQKLLPKGKVICKCVCGNEKEFYLTNIYMRKTGRYTQSCGCKRGEIVSSKTKTHGLSKTRLYRHWRSMHDRLLPSYIDSKSYVGITIDDSWHDFKKFYDDMQEEYYAHAKIHGERNTTLDRIDVYSGYSKGNCRWATKSIQSLNKKNTVYAIYNGEKVPLISLCRKLNKQYDLVRRRLRNGWQLEEALNTPLWERRCAAIEKYKRLVS